MAPCRQRRLPVPPGVVPHVVQVAAKIIVSTAWCRERAVITTSRDYAIGKGVNPTEPYQNSFPHSRNSPSSYDFSTAFPHNSRKYRLTEEIVTTVTSII
jgi:hypothetical protein